MVSLGFGWYLVVLEGRGPVDGLVESHRLVWGQWWRTASVVTIAVIIYSVPSSVVGAIVGFVIAMFAFSGHAADDPSQAAAIAQHSIAVIVLPMAIVQFLVSTLLMPMLLSMMLVQFRDLQLRKSGADLVVRAEAT
jgi:hypothetical protein